MAEDTYTWAYGVVPAGHPGVAAPGIEGRPVEPIRHGGLAVLASEVPAERYSDEALRRRLEDLETVEALARSHDAVLDAALRAGDVLPFRMCTLYETPEAVVAALGREAGRFAETLERLRGKAEWGVKAFVKPRAEAAAGGRAASGTEYLARRRAERQAVAEGADALETAAADIHARLADRASAAVMARLQDRRLSGRSEEMILNGAYLVPRTDAADFSALVVSLAERYAEHGLELTLTGPWPAYHFVTEAAA
jgi:hypothetical protein